MSSATHLESTQYAASCSGSGEFHEGGMRCRCELRSQDKMVDIHGVAFATLPLVHVRSASATQ